MTDAQAQQAQEEMQAILARSATDPAFREKLLSDSHGAIAEHTGRDVPETLSVSFIENEADATVVLPDYRDPEAELAEDQLEAVAGGAGVPYIPLAGIWVASDFAK